MSLSTCQLDYYANINKQHWENHKGMGVDLVNERVI